MTYYIEDLEQPVQIYPPHLMTHPLEKAIEETFSEDFPYLCLDDIPCIEYIKHREVLEIGQVEYELSDELKEYCENYQNELRTKPIPEIKIPPVELEFTHPENDDEKGFIAISKTLERMTW